MSLSLNQVVNISVEQTSAGATKRDMSVISIFTDEMCDDFYEKNTRYVVVSSADDVANLFGTDSRAYKTAQAAFSARPKVKTALVAKYIKTALNVEAQPAKINGSSVSSFGYVQYKQITDGYFSFTLGGEVVTIKGLSFTTVSSLEEVATIIDTAIDAATESKATITFDDVGNRFILKLKTAGAGDSFGYVYDESLEGTYIGSSLNLIDGKATIYKGTDATTYPAESVADAMTALENKYQNWYCAYFANVITDSELQEAHAWVVSADLKIMAYTETREANIESVDTNVLNILAKKNSGRIMVQYNNTSDEYAAAEMAAIAVSTVWTGNNTAKTVKFKQETSVTSDPTITINEATKCKRLGINYYTDYSGVNMLAEGTMLGGTFIDITTGLDAFTNALQVQLFNKMQGASSKIPQTDRGQAILLACAAVIGEQFRNNGFLAGGTWTGDDIGDLTYGDTMDTGYYFYSDSFSTQDTSDRNARKMMPIMCALKLAGAGHTVDVVVKYNI